MNQTNRNYCGIAARVCALLASALVIAACGSSGGDDAAAEVAGKGPQFSLEVEAFCGNPAMVPIYDADGTVIIGYEDPTDTNVAVRLTDVSDDNGPEGAIVGNLTIECTAAVKNGRGKPDDVPFASISIDDPGFGIIEATCPLGSLPEGATEWKASATASGGDVRRVVMDTCDEIAVQ